MRSIWKAYYMCDRLLYYNFRKGKSNLESGDIRVHPIFRVLFKCPNRIRKNSERPVTILPFFLKKLPPRESHTDKLECFGWREKQRSCLGLHHLLAN